MHSGPAPGRTLTLALPAQYEDASTAFEKWLLALWQCSPKSIWVLRLGPAPISLELRAAAGQVRYQVRLANRLSVDVTKALLSAHFSGLELTEGGESQQAFAPPGAILNFGLRSPGWIDLPNDKTPEGIAGVLRAMEQLATDDAALVQILLEPTWMSTEDGRQPAFWLAGRIVAASSSTEAAGAKAQLVAASFGQFAGFNGLRFSRPQALKARDARTIERRLWPHLLSHRDLLTPK